MLFEFGEISGKAEVGQGIWIKLTRWTLERGVGSQSLPFAAIDLYCGPTNGLVDFADFTIRLRLAISAAVDTIHLLKSISFNKLCNGITPLKLCLFQRRLK